MSKSGRPRYRDYLQALWCLAFDWIEGLQPLYRSDRRGPLVWVGSKAGVIWYMAHNGRVYNWLDWRPDWFEDEPVEKVIAAFEAGEKGLTGPPEPTTGPLSHHWECPAGHQRISSTQPLRGGQCYCGEVMVISAVTS